MFDNADELIKKGEEMAGRKKKSKEKNPLFTEQEQHDMLCDMIGSIVGAKNINAFIIIAENNVTNHIKVCNMDEIRCLGYAEKIGLLMKNRMLIQMVKANENDKSKKRRNT